MAVSPGLKRSRGVPDSTGGVGARTMKGHKGKEGLEQDKKIIRQEQSDKQGVGGEGPKRRGQSSELIGIVRGEQRRGGRKTSLKPRPDTGPCRR